MKTVMELALARIELMKDINPNSVHWEMFKNDCMEKEKEQIIDFTNSFYNDCITEGESLKQSAEEYYNKTYNQNK